MTLLADLVAHLNEHLQVAAIDDYCPNGLQVQGSERVVKIVCGVTASQRLLDEAVVRGADAVLVHHGYFWKSEPRTLAGMRRARLKTLLANDISLLAYHLPLDLHPQHGNNVQLAQVLGWQPVNAGSGALVLHGELERDYSGAELAAHIATRLQRAPLHIDAARPIRRIAWCTGAAQGYIGEAVALGCDAYVSGEVSESTVHEARENGVHFFAAGHHATERYGVRALGDHVAQRFGISCEFVDCDNPA
ncbi:MAG: Nif3-like dinuclear metal center hexameric protein [Pseudomonadales bacterium]